MFRSLTAIEVPTSDRLRRRSSRSIALTAIVRRSSSSASPLCDLRLVDAENRSMAGPRGAYGKELLPGVPTMRILGAFALLLALGAQANAACYYNRDGQFCVDEAPAAPRANGGLSGSFRTLCVRSCDGFYFPISYATDRSHFKTD